MLGTLINAGAVIIGCIIGLLIHSRLPKNIIKIVFQGIGLFILFLGIQMADKTNNFLIMIFSIVLGSIIGELIDIDKLVNIFSEWLKKKVKSKNDNFSDGFTTAFILFCLGSMTILGAFEEGLGGAPNLLLAKSLQTFVISSFALVSLLWHILKELWRSSLDFSIISLLLFASELI